MTDGVYDIEITMTGGTGKAYIISPVKLTVSGGSMTARMEWSSSKYDLMIVDGKEFLPVNSGGNSVFDVPVATLDEPLEVKAETVAMSEPHLIEYVITFDKSSLPSENSVDIPLAAGGAVLVAAVVCCAVIAFVKAGKKKNDKEA